MREKKRFEIEVHVAGICLRKEDEKWQVLIAKRSPTRRLYPNLWECGGGQVKFNENFEEAVKRHLRQELGVIVEPKIPAGVYEILVPELEQKKIPGFYFACKVSGFVSGDEPRIDEEFTEWKWQDVSKLEEINLIPGIKENIENAVKLMR